MIVLAKSSLHHHFPLHSVSGAKDWWLLFMLNRFYLPHS